MRPSCAILIDGAPASGLLMERLMSCVVTDEAGVAADRVEIELADDPPAAIPRRGAIIAVHMGYAGALSFMGEFSAEDIDVGLMPRTLRITGTSAAFMSAAKGQVERAWDDVTLGQVIEQIAGENGLRARIDAALAPFRYDWLGQVGESDLAFLDRLAQRHNALFSIKGGQVVFARRGAGRTPSGLDLTPVRLTPQMLAPNSARVLFSERPRFAEVTASYMDRATRTRREVSVPLRPDGPDAGDEPDGEGAFTLDQPFASEAEARAAAEAQVAQLKRRAVTFVADIIGTPEARGGAPATFQGVRPGIDGVPFIIETAQHRFGKGGYTTSLTGSLKA